VSSLLQIRASLIWTSEFGVNEDCPISMGPIEDLFLLVGKRQ
jgi:hypothetical protein